MRTLLIPLLIALLAPPLAAQPVPEAERIPVDFRRTTLVVRDVDASLALYRDALGLTQIYDQLIGGGTDAEGKPIAPTIRLVLLRANDTFIGNLGLMQRLDRDPPARRPNAKALAGQPILVFNLKDQAQRFPKIAAVPGVAVETAPTLIEYPAPGGGKIPVMFASIYDPDGFFIEVNQLLGAAAGTAPAAPTAPPRDD